MPGPTPPRPPSEAVHDSTPVFGKYQVLSRLGAGGMGEILLARELRLQGNGSLIILKSLLPDLAEKSEALNMFLDEARLSSFLAHPNAVSVFEAGEWEGTFYLAMEYIPGVDVSKLRSLARAQGALVPPRIVACIIHDAALGLDHAHGSRDREGRPTRLVHRDVSPQNLMVRTDGLTKVVDFGVAKAATRAARTRTGLVKGKFRYMSPEQIRNQPLDGRSDQFALGVVAWEALTGARLFDGPDPAAISRQVLNLPVGKPSQVIPGLPPGLEEAVLRMLARDRDRRFPSCLEAAKAIEPALGGIEDARREAAVLVEQLAGARIRSQIASAQARTTPALRAAPPESRRCPSCGFMNGGGNRFCGQCGAGLDASLTPARPGTPPNPMASAELAKPGPAASLPTAPPAMELARRDVVVLVVQLDSPARSDGEAAMVRATRLLDTAAQVAQEHGAQVTQLTVERVVLVFGASGSTAQAPRQAARAAQDLIQRATALPLPTPPKIRAGLECGVAMVGGTPLRIAGAPLERATALCEDAGIGEAWVGPSIEGLLRGEVPLGPELAGAWGRARALRSEPGLIERLPFVGRTDALGLAAEVSVAIAQGTPLSLVFAGPSGSGKSRLLEECCRTPATAPRRAEAHGGARGGPMGLVLDLLIHLASGEPSLEPLATLGCEGPQRAALRRRLRPESEPATVRPADDAALLEIFRRAARPGGLLLAIDDLHRADESSLTLLEALLAAGDQPIGLLATESPSSAPRLATLPRYPVEGLTSAEVDALAAALLGGAVPATVSQWVRSRSRGFPGHAAELLRTLSTSGALRRRGGALQAEPGWEKMEVPESLAFAVAGRLDRLTAPALRFARTAAAWGSHFPAPLIEDALGEPGSAVVLGELRRQLLIEPARRAGEYRFTPELAVEVVLGRMSPEERRRTHLALGEAASEFGGDGIGCCEAAAADQFLAAGDPALAIGPCREAGRALSARGEWRAASTYLRRAIELAPEDTPSQRLELLDALAQAAAVWARSEPEQVAGLVQPRLERLPRQEAPALWAEVSRHWARAELKLAKLAPAEARINEALNLARGADAEIEAWLLSDLAAIYEARGTWAKASTTLGAAFRRMEGRPARDPDFYWENLNRLGRIQLRLGHRDWAHRYFTQAREQAQRAGRPLGEVKALANLAVHRAAGGDLVGALDDWETARELAEQMGDLEELARLHYNAASALRTLGRLEGARARLLQARDQAGATEWREGEALAISALATLDSAAVKRGESGAG